MAAPSLRVGVLALQGDFAEHLSLLSRFGGVTAVDVRDAATLQTCHALIIPGGESTAVRLIAERYHLLAPLRAFAATNPVWGVCAGMICLADHLEHDSETFADGQREKGLIGGLQVTIARNFFGNQSRSSYRKMNLTAAATGLCDTSHFIRAPAVAGAIPATVTVLATVGEENTVVAVRQGHLLGTAFHPEVSQDTTWTAYFLNEVCKGVLAESGDAAAAAAAAVYTCDPLPAVSMHYIPDAAALAEALAAGGGVVYGSVSVKRAMPRFLAGGVIMDVVNAEQARVAEAAGACSVMALERIPADIKRDGGIARMSDPELIRGIQAVVSIPVMAKARIGHFAEAQVLQSLDVDCIDESEVLTPADEVHHIRKVQYGVPFVCGAKNLGEALRRIAEGAAMIRLKGNAGTGNVMHAVRHARAVFAEIRQLVSMDEDEVYVFAKEHQSPLELVRLTRALGRLPVTTFAAGGIATPADVMLLMSMGCDGVFVGSGIFKGANSPQRARAMVEACTYWRRPEIVAQVSAGLGKAMVGILDNGETYNYVADSVL